MQFRTLRPEEISVKVKKVSEKGVLCLLYKTARVDADILDEAVGPENWMNDFKEIKGNLYAGIGIRCEGGFIWKWDCGIESREDEGNEKKGEASDAFKRAGFKCGIGRELYSAPFIWIPAQDTKISKNQNKYTCDDKFSVDSIAYDENRKIIELTINNKQGKTVFTFKYGGKQPYKTQKSNDKSMPPDSKGASYGGNVCTRYVTEERAKELYKVGETAGYSEGKVNGMVMKRFKKRVYELDQQEFMQVYAGFAAAMDGGNNESNTARGN